MPRPAHNCRTAVDAPVSSDQSAASFSFFSARVTSCCTAVSNERANRHMCMRHSPLHLGSRFEVATARAILGAPGLTIDHLAAIDDLHAAEVAYLSPVNCWSVSRIWPCGLCLRC
jgi:hypothetical protein